MVMALYQERAYTIGLDVTTTIRMESQLAADTHLRTGLMEAQARRGYRGPEGLLPVAGDAKDSVRKLRIAYPDSGELRAAVVTDIGPKQISALLRDGSAIQIGAVDPRIAGGWAKLPAGGKRSIVHGSVIRVYQDKNKAERWLLSQMPEMEGALISLDAGSGDILALAGGFDFS